MIIRFDEMDLTVLPAFKGGEKEYRAKMFFDGSNRIMKGTLIPGASIGMHTHEDSSETIFIIKGQGPSLMRARGRRFQKATASIVRKATATV